MRDALQGRAHDDCRCEGTMPARPRQPLVQGAVAKPAVGQRFHLRLDLAGLRVRSLRYQRFRPPNRRLACQ